MRSRFLILFLFIAAFAAESQSISGRVLEAAQGRPLSSAAVIITVNESHSRDTVQTDIDGSWQYTLPSARVDPDVVLPVEPYLMANYPNPFNPYTTLSFYLPKNEFVRLIIHNTRGQEVARRESFLAAGAYRILWRSLGAAGVYFYTLHCGDITLTRKMMQLDGGNDGGFSNFFFSGNDPANTLLPKSTGTTVKMVFEKFSYRPDTLQQSIFGGEFFQTHLHTVHDHAVVVDLHNDVLELMINDRSYRLKDRHSWWHTDIPRLRQGGVDVQFFVLWPDPVQFGAAPFAAVCSMINIMKEEETANPNDLLQVTHTEGALTAVKDGKIAYLFGVEGGHTIENDLEKLYYLYHAGMRYLTITWNNSTDWAVSAADYRTRTVGLSDFGRQVIRALDSLGVLIDVSHVGIKTIDDILAITRNPIMASHSGARALRDHYRNLYDEQILAIAEKGGLVGVVFYPNFLVKSQRAYLSDVVAHIDHIVKVAGIDHVALGSDFDGFGGWGPSGLEDTSKFPNLTMALLQQGYTAAEVEKILGGNVLRLLRRVCSEKLSGEDIRHSSPYARQNVSLTETP